MKRPIINLYIRGEQINMRYVESKVPIMKYMYMKYMYMESIESKANENHEVWILGLTDRIITPSY